MGSEAVGVGVYVRPADATDDPDHTHKLEGDVWAVERLPDPKTGELVDWAHVVRVWQGALVFHMLPFDRIGSAHPTHPSNIDSLIKLAAKEMLKKGRRTEPRFFALVHACEHMLALPQVVTDVPSIFDDPEPTVSDVTRPGVTVDHDTQVLKLVDRLAKLDHTVGNEVRRSAITLKLPALQPGAELTLSDLVAYDALLARWERLAAARVTAAAS